MTRNDRLLEELREALGALNEIEDEEAELRASLKEKRAEIRSARVRVDEIQREILTGSSGRPILDRIAEKEETADERQRGPTAPESPPAAIAAKSIREPKLSPANHTDGRTPGPEHAGPVPWRSHELDAILRVACEKPQGFPVGAWATFRRLGSITDVQIDEALRSIWPSSYAYSEATVGNREMGYTVHGGSFPAFWVGPRRPETMQKPTLEGKPLRDRVRSILNLPRAPQHVEDEAAAADKAARKGGKPRRARAREDVSA